MCVSYLHLLYIKVNGQTGIVNVGLNEFFQVTYEVVKGNADATPHEYWFAGINPFANFWIDSSFNVIPSQAPIINATHPIVDEGPTVLWQGTAPLGTYTMFGVIEDIVDGSLALDGVGEYRSTVQLNVGLSSSPTPTVAIKVNGQTGIVNVGPNDFFQVTYEVTNATGDPAPHEYWFAGQNPFGNFWIDSSFTVIPSQVPIIHATRAIVNEPPTVLWQGTAPLGVYSMFGVIEDIVDGVTCSRWSR